VLRAKPAHLTPSGLTAILGSLRTIGESGEKGHWAVSHLPDWGLVQAGNLFYKHLG